MTYKLQPDKTLHLLCGALVAAVFMPFGPGAAILASWLAGMAKEAFDAAINYAVARWGFDLATRDVDPMDAVYTIVGGWAFIVVHACVVALKGWLA